MRRVIRCLTRAFVVFVLLAASAPADLRAAVPVPLQAPPPTKCCFTNPGYAGTCEVEPAKDESCGSILDYLNNPRSQGKGYCGNTEIRGGWKSVPCEPKK